MPKGSYQIKFYPNNSHPPEIFPDLFEREIYAIGFLTWQWSFLEHNILLSTEQFAKKLKLPIPSGASNFSFTRRLSAWRQMIEKTRKSKRKGRLLKLVSKIANVESRRHKIIHGLWTWTYSNPEQATTFSFWPRSGNPEPFDFDKLLKLGELVGQINFEILYPGGKKQAFLALASQGSYVSRAATLMLMGKEDLGRPRSNPRSSASPPKGKEPQ
jgi:hypothetical protein